MKHRLIEFETPEEAMTFIKDHPDEGTDLVFKLEDLERGISSRVVYSGKRWRQVKKGCAGAHVTETKDMGEALSFMSRSRLDDLQADSESTPRPPALREKALQAWKDSQASWMQAREDVKNCETQIARLRLEKQRLERAVVSRRLYCYETSASLVRTLGRVPIEVDGKQHYPQCRGRRVFYVAGNNLKDDGQGDANDG